MVKLLCIVEVKGNNVERARQILDRVRQQMTDNDITGLTISQATSDDLSGIQYAVQGGKLHILGS